MITSVRLDDNLERELKNITKSLHKSKSEIIREAIIMYIKHYEEEKKNRILKAIKKTKEIDEKEFEDFKDLTDEGL